MMRRVIVGRRAFSPHKASALFSDGGAEAPRGLKSAVQDSQRGE